MLMLVQAVLGMFVAFMLARLLGPHGFGVYSFGLAVATVLTIPTRNGVSGLVVREVARAAAAEDWGRLRGAMRWAWSATVAYSIVVGGIVTGFCITLASGHPLAEITAISTLLVPAWSLLGNWSAGVRGLVRPIPAVLADTVLRPGIHLTLICVMVVFWSGMTPDAAMFLNVAATGAASLWIMLFFAKCLPASAKNVVRVRGASWDLARAAVPFAAISGLQITIRQADLILLGIMTDETQVGLYRVALQGSMLITFGAQAVNIVVAPYFARHDPADGIEPLWKLMRISVLVALTVGIPGASVFIVFGKELIGFVFGPAFAGASLPLAVLSVANAVALLNGAVVPLLNMTGRERETLIVFALAVGFTVIFNVILIPLFSTAGAALAALLSTCIWSLLLRRLARRRLSLDPVATIFSTCPPQRPVKVFPGGQE